MIELEIKPTYLKQGDKISRGLHLNLRICKKCGHKVQSILNPNIKGSTRRCECTDFTNLSDDVWCSDTLCVCFCNPVHREYYHLMNIGDDVWTEKRRELFINSSDSEVSTLF